MIRFKIWKCRGKDKIQCEKENELKIHHIPRLAVAQKSQTMTLPKLNRDLYYLHKTYSEFVICNA